jgi:hypothetical protein
MRICNGCGQSKKDEDFPKDPRVKSGRATQCRACRNAYLKSYHQTNRDKRLKAQRLDYQQNKTKYQVANRNYRQQNKDKLRLKDSLYYQKNKSKIIARISIWEKARRKSNPQHRISHNLRKRLWEALHKQSLVKNQKTFDLIGCNMPTLMSHLEKQFTNGMSWENYGKKGWHIDHIKPCAAFNLSNPEEQKACFHYTNLQPLWECDNLAKGDSLNWQLKPISSIGL